MFLLSNPPQNVGGDFFVDVTFFVDFKIKETAQFSKRSNFSVSIFVFKPIGDMKHKVFGLKKFNITYFQNYLQAGGVPR